jgi:hypothetical protein
VQSLRGDEVARDDLAVRVRSLPLLDELIGKLAAERSVASQRAGIDPK